MVRLLVMYKNSVLGVKLWINSSKHLFVQTGEDNFCYNAIKSNIILIQVSIFSRQGSYFMIVKQVYSICWSTTALVLHRIIRILLLCFFHFRDFNKKIALDKATCYNQSQRVFSIIPLGSHMLR